MKWLAALVVLLMPAIAAAHPHIWISQHVRVISENGQYIAVELEWRFDPMPAKTKFRRSTKTATVRFP